MTGQSHPRTRCNSPNFGARESPGDRRGVGGVAAFSGDAHGQIMAWKPLEGRELVGSSGCLGLGLGLCI